MISLLAAFKQSRLLVFSLTVGVDDVAKVAGIWRLRVPRPSGQEMGHISNQQRKFSQKQMDISLKNARTCGGKADVVIAARDWLFFSQSRGTQKVTP